MFVPITSPRNPRIKDVIRLRDRKGRDGQGRIRIDGAREVRRAIAAGIAIVELYVCPEWCGGQDAQAVLAACQPSRESPAKPAAGLAPALFSAAPDLFAKLAFGDRADGIVAVAHAPRRSLDELRLPSEPLVAVLDGIEKPGNLGAILRSADGAGLDAVVVVEGGTDLFNPHVIRASLGTVFSVPACTAARQDVVSWMHRLGLRILAARVEGAQAYHQVALTGPVALVLGAEDRGLSDCWRTSDISAINLPMRGAADSLNVSAAAAVLFYEALRQRTLRQVSP